MLFNSIDFAVFFPIVFLLYWKVFGGRLREQNLLLLLSSYVFYGWWDWRFLGLIGCSTLLDFLIARGIERVSTQTWRKLLLYVSVFINLGLLGFFKYYNFFVTSFIDAFSFLGRPLEISTLKIILPVGISFYTFQTLSYSIDVYRKRVQASKNFVDFAAFVSFFPQLVAGPIERAKDLLPQFKQERRFVYAKAVDGLRQILFGLFKKIVIADNCAVLVNGIFGHYEEASGAVLLLGAVLFAFQIYGDFSGYSDMAIGLARMLGFDLTRNFAYPYFSRSIAEFWRRWHISLSNWFKDYLYIPLGGSRGGRWMQIRNTFVVFLVSGFWHGANWTFIIWGGLNAALFLPLLLSNNNRNYLGTIGEGKNGIRLKEFGHMFLTFLLICFTWIFFRSVDLESALAYVSRMFMYPLSGQLPTEITKPQNWLFSPLLIVMIGFEWVGRFDEHALENTLLSKPKLLRWSIYVGFVLAALILSGKEKAFIYFQF